MSATHQAFGLTWQMPFDFPPYARVDAEGTPADVVVAEASVPRPGSGADWAGPLRAVEGSAVTFGMPGAARMRITGGTRIDVQRHEDWTEEGLRLLLMGPGAALILHQRGVLPLHGSGIVTDRGAVLIVGHSGAGKSTTLGAFMDRGYPVLCDDLAAVTIGDDQVPRVFPGTRVMKVWADSASSLGWQTEGLARVRPELEKFVVPIARQSLEPVPLFAVYQLSSYNGLTVEIEHLQKARKFNVILDHTWQKMTVKRMGLHGDHFQRAVAVADRVRVVRVRRPDGVGIEDNHLVDRIIADIES